MHRWAKNHFCRIVSVRPRVTVFADQRTEASMNGIIVHGTGDGRAGVNKNEPLELGLSKLVQMFFPTLS